MQENNLIHLAFPDSEISDSLRQEVQNRTSSLHARHQGKVRTRRAIIGSIASFAVIASAVVAGPKAYALYGMRRIDGSMSDCQSAIMEGFELGKDGQFHPDRTTIYSQGKWRIEYHGTTQIYSNQTLWNYDPELNQVIKKFRPNGPFSHNSSGFSVMAMVEDGTRFGWKDKTTFSSGTLEGKPVEILTIEQSTWPTQAIIYADPNTHMPIKMTQATKRKGIWEISGYSTFKFNSNIDAKQFEPKFPATAAIVDVQNLKAKWAAKLEKPITEFQTSHGKVAIRDIAVNERGHIFVVYTDGQTAAQESEYWDTYHRTNVIPPAPFRVQLKANDTLGTTYFASDGGPGIGFQPYVGNANSKVPSEYVSLRDGQIPHGIWFIPSKIEPWKPKTITLSFTTDDKDFKWSLNLEKPTIKLIPDWMVVCGMGPRSAKDVIKEEYNVHLVMEMIPPNAKADDQGRVQIKYKYGR